MSDLSPREPSSGSQFDTIIRNGSVVDGSRGAQPESADVGISEGEITFVGDLTGAVAPVEFDARGKIIAPGFIDVHNHSDGALARDGHQPAKVSQGFTTEVLMADGISYAPVTELTWKEWYSYLKSLNGLSFSDYQGNNSIESFMSALDGRVTQNVMTHVPYANARTKVAGFGKAPISPKQMQQIQEEIAVGMEAGAVGLSTGLDYLNEFYATTEELIAACKPVAEAGGLYVTHVRYALGTLGGVKEAVEIAEQAGVRLHVSHLFGLTTEETDSLLNYIDEEALNRVDFTFDFYPYMSTSTMLNSLLPYSVWEDGAVSALAKLHDPVVREEFGKILESTSLPNAYIAWTPGEKNKEFEGRSLQEYVDASKKSVKDALSDLLIEENLAVLLVFRKPETNSTILPMLQHDRYMMGSDGIPAPHTHPRHYGSAPALLRLARETGFLSLGDAVHKMTGFPSSQFGVPGRGLLRAGQAADLVVFDPETVADTATLDTPRSMPDGIEQVLVNGILVDRGDEGKTGEVIPADQRPGRRLRFTPGKEGER